MNADAIPPEQAAPARASMYPSAPLLETTAPVGWSRQPTSAQRLLAFFDSGLFRVVGYAALTPLLLQSLGDTAFGVMAVTLALLGLLGWLPQAVQSETARLVAAARRVGDRDREQALLDSSCLVLAVIGGGVLGSLTLLRNPLAALLEVGGPTAHVFGLYLLLEGARFALAALVGAWTAGVDGLGTDVERASLRGLQAALSVTFGLVVVSHGLGLPGLAGFGIATVFATALATWRTLRRVRPERGPRPWHAERGVLVELLTSSAVAGSQQASFLLAVETGVLVVAAVLGVHAVPLYAIAAHGCRLLVGASLQLASGLYPPFSSLALHTERLHARWVFRRGTDAALIAGSGLAVVLVPFGAGLLEQWLGLRDVSRPMVAMLGLLLLTSAPLAVAARYVARVGLHARLAGVLVAEVTLAVVLGLLLVGRYGPTGVATAAVVAETAAAAVLVHMACQHLGIRPWRFWAGRTWRLALIVTPALGAAGLFVLVKSIRTVRELVLQMGIVLILNAVAAFAAWYLMETRPEQDID